MKLTFWRKGRIVCTRRSSIDDLLANPIPDKEVEDLLQQKMDGVGTQFDDCNLDKKIRNSKDAKVTYEAIKAMHPEKNLRIRCIKRIVRRACLILLLLISSLSVIYAILHHQGLLPQSPAIALPPALPPPPALQPAALPVPGKSNPGTYSMRLDSLMDSAEVRYKKIIVLDEAEIANMHCSARLDSTVSLKNFLDYVTTTNELTFYYDAVRVIHIRQAVPTDTKEK